MSKHLTSMQNIDLAFVLFKLNIKYQQPSSHDFWIGHQSISSTINSPIPNGHNLDDPFLTEYGDSDILVWLFLVTQVACCKVIREQRVWGDKFWQGDQYWRGWTMKFVKQIIVIALQREIITILW